MATLSACFIVGEFRISELFVGFMRLEAGRKSNLYLKSEMTRSSSDDLSTTMSSRPGALLYPSVLLMEGFRKSASISKVRAPLFATNAAKDAATVVFPSPGSAETMPTSLPPAG